MKENETKREPKRSAAGTPFQAVMIIGFILFVILLNLFGYDESKDPVRQRQLLNYVLSSPDEHGDSDTRANELDDFDYARKP